MKFDLSNAIYNDPDQARAHLESQLWPDGPVCPHCSSQEATALGGSKHRKGLYQCNACRLQFSVTVGTVFERSKIGLHKWVLASHLMAASKKGMSAKQIERMLRVTYKTAWFMMHRIREAMSPELVADVGPLGGESKTIEADETFVGGKKKNVHNGKPEPKKHPVVALVERGGKARAKHVADVTAKTVRDVLVTNASRKSDLNTDDSLVYYWLGREFAKHRSVNHSKDEYVGKDGETVNSAESFFALLKRGIMGSFHSVSEAHLQRYVDEFTFRWNHRSALEIDDFTRANAIVNGAAGKRLTYRRIGEAKNA
jgi:transposase-like protein